MYRFEDLKMGAGLTFKLFNLKTFQQ